MSKTCKYKIKLKGKKPVFFDTKEKALEYAVKNQQDGKRTPNIIEVPEIASNVCKQMESYFEDSRQSLNKLREKRRNGTEDESIYFDEEKNQHVTSFIEKLTFNDGDKDINVVTQFNVDDWKENIRSNFTSQEEFDRYVAIQLKKWDVIRLAGIVADRIQGMIFNKFYGNIFTDNVENLKENWRANLLKEFNDNSQESKEIRDIIEVMSPEFVLNIGKATQRIKKTIFDTQKKSDSDKEYVAFYNQANMQDRLNANPDVTLRAKADLIVHKQSGEQNSGQVYIVDFKLSSKQYSENQIEDGWDISKKYAARTQLQLEKQMLLNNCPSIKSSNIFMGLITSRVIINDDAFVYNEKTQEVTIDTNKVLVANVESTEYNSITNTETDFYNKIVVPVEIAIAHESSNSFAPESKISPDITSQVQELFPVMFINKQFEYYNFEEEAKKKIKQNANGKYYFTTYKDNNPQVIERDTLEEITAAFKADKNNKLQQERQNIQDNIKEIKKQLDNFNQGKQYDLTRHFCTQAQLVLRKYFTKSTGQWRVLDADVIYQDLADLNTIVFVNDETKQFDVITLQKNAHLEQQIIMNPQNKSSRQTVLGMNYDDNKIANAQDSKDILTSKLGNILLMRASLIANKLAETFGEKQYKIHTIGVLKNSGRGGEFFTDTPDVITKNLGYLISERQKNSDNKQLFKMNLSMSSFLSQVDYAYDILKQIILAEEGAQIDKLTGAFYDIKTDFKGSIEHVENSSNYIDMQLAKVEMLKKVFKFMSKNFKVQNGFVQSAQKSTLFDFYVYKQVAFALAGQLNQLKHLFDLNVEQEYGLMPSWSNLKNGEFFNGTYFSTMDTSQTSLPFYKMLEIARENYRRKANHFDVTVKPLFNLIHNKFAKNLTTFSYKKFFYTQDGSKEFRLKNPYVQGECNDLTAEEIDWLKQYLTQLAILRYGEDDRTKDDYFLVPLYRASVKERLNADSKTSGFFHGIKEGWKQLKQGEFLEKGMSEEQEEDFNDTIKDYRQTTEMYNVFNLDRETRTKVIENSIIEDKDPFLHFSSDLENVMYQYMQAKYIKEEYDKVLPIISATISAISFAGEMSGKTQDESVKFLTEYIKSTVFNEPLHDKNPGYSTLGVAKEAVSAAVLGFNAISGTKECVVGLMTHLNKAISNGLPQLIIGGQDAGGFLNITNMTKAYTTVWIDAFKQTAIITLLERLNNIYGVSNMDSNEIANSLTYGISDTFRLRYYMYWCNKAPDFLHRMTFLIGYMMQHGVYDAISIDDNGHLKYDWRKDKRFDLLSNPNASKTSEAYLNQKALYINLMNDIKEQLDVFDEKTKTWRKLKWNGDFDYKENDELPYPYSREDVNSIVQESNITFGYMDHDTKSPFFKKGIGLYIGQFVTFVSAKKIEWLLKPDRYNRGYRSQKVDIEGNKVYYDINGAETTETTTTLESGEVVNNTPVYEFHYMMMEGIAWSLLYTGKDIFKGNFKKAFSNRYRLNNCLVGIGQLLLMWFYYWLGNLIYKKSVEEQKTKREEANKNIDTSDPNAPYHDGFDVDVFFLRLASKVFTNASGDFFGLQSVASMFKMNTPSLDFFVGQAEGLYRLFTGQGPFALIDSFGATRIIQPWLKQQQKNAKRKKKLEEKEKEKQNSK